MKNISVSQKNHWLARFQRSTHHGDTLWSGLIIVASFLVLALVIAIGGMLWQQSADARAQFGWAFVLPTSNSVWDPLKGVYQSWAFIYGTLITSLFAIIFAIPISLGIAVFLAELCPEPLRLPLGWMIELLAAIPSVVYGLWDLRFPSQGGCAGWSRLGCGVWTNPFAQRFLYRSDSIKRLIASRGRHDFDHYDCPNHHGDYSRCIAGNS
jgi:ABC-type phosphate/phosphonate transport system permease subunit